MNAETERQTDRWTAFGTKLIYYFSKEKPVGIINKPQLYLPEHINQILESLNVDFSTSLIFVVMLTILSCQSQ